MSKPNNPITGLQYREAPAAAPEVTEERTFTALAVPWETETELWPGIAEKFQRGALTGEAVKLRLEHRETIGVVTALEDTEAGLMITGRISHTRAGDDAYTLAKDGALSAVSVGFEPHEYAITERDDDTLYTHTRAQLLEVSLVSFPAYEDAKVSEVRNRKETPAMDTTENTEVVELRAGLEELRRTLETVRDNTAGGTAAPACAFRSAGEYIKAAANGDPRALELREATETAVLADTAQKPVWVNKTLRLMEAKQKITNIFTHSYTLPAAGMSYEYPEIATNTVKVSEQANETDDLPFGKITLETASAAVKTYGGWSEVSKQVVQRASVNYLDALHRAQAIAYANEIERATRILVTETIKTNLTTTPVEAATTAAALTVNGLIDLLLALTDHFDNKVIFPLEGIAVSPDVFGILAKLPEQRKALQFTPAPDSKQGTLSVTAASANLAGLPVVSLGSGTGIFAGYSSAAIEVLESPGAPLRLNDQNIRNLTEQYSVYGYAAHSAPAPAALVPVKFKAA